MESALPLGIVLGLSALGALALWLYGRVSRRNARAIARAGRMGC